MDIKHNLDAADPISYICPKVETNEEVCWNNNNYKFIVAGWLDHIHFSPAPDTTEIKNWQQTIRNQTHENRTSK